ncbi:quinone oxidoreductase-like protein 2 isoform X8 [Rattus norvegicus]|uniref:quinone oxidoreductase-like protein 2 isoform X8 n=1 Tax=Rattus norvegicus TaxID=10116 RepID=UPI0019171285|nr:quinone oxidoreductase-like protein 2 isoform X10 [Rattus norvegicus]
MAEYCESNNSTFFCGQRGILASRAGSKPALPSCSLHRVEAAPDHSRGGSSPYRATGDPVADSRKRLFARCCGPTSILWHSYFGCRSSGPYPAWVIAAAGSDEKCKLAMQRGAQSGVNYSQGSLKDAVKKLVGSSGVNVAIDMVGGDVFLDSLRSLAWEGRIVVLGFAGGNIASVPSNLLLLKNISAMGLYWGRYQHQDFAVFSKSMSTALQYCQQGLIHPHTGAVFKLEKVNDAFLHVMQRKSTGKVLLSLK